MNHTAQKALDAETQKSVAQAVQKEKKHRNRPDLANYGAEKALPGDNTRFLRNAMVSLSLPPIDISDPEQVKQRIIEYFNWCAENDVKPKVMGVANWLGVSRDTLNTWKNGEYRSDTHSDTIRKTYGLLEELWEGYMQENKINTVSGIFLGKVFFGYKEPTEVIVTPGTPLGSEGSAEEVQKRIDSGVIIDAESLQEE